MTEALVQVPTPVAGRTADAIDNVLVDNAGATTVAPAGKAKRQVVTLGGEDGSRVSTVTGGLPVSAASLPLPSGAATEATLATRAADTTTAAVRDRLPSAFTAGGGVKVGIVDALPAGSATIGKVDQGAAGASAWPVSVIDTDTIVASTTETLAGGAVYTSAWIDCAGIPSFTILVLSDVASGSSGLVVQWGEDGSTAIATSVFTYDTPTIGRFFPLGVQARYARVIYTNGAAPQGSFALYAKTHTEVLQFSTVAIDSALVDSAPVIPARMVLTARRGANDYVNQGATSAGNPKVAVAEHSVDTPIKALTSWQVNQFAVANSAVQLVPTALTGRKTVAVKALVANTMEVYVNNTSAVATGNGWELAAGDSIEVEIDAGASLWAIAPDATVQRVCVAEVA